MSSDNTIKHFTAVDIEKYHSGKLSVAEMHAIEKAAMDDPFLAEALEGYANAGSSVSSDINELKERLAKKIEGAKVIPMTSASKSRSYFLRVAVLLFFIAGAGLLIYQLGFNKKDKGIAQNSEAKNQDKELTTGIDSSTITSVTKNAEPSGTLVNTDQPKSIPRQTGSREQHEKNQTAIETLSQEKIKEGKPTAATERDVASGLASPGKDVTVAPMIVQPVTSSPRSVEEDNKPANRRDNQQQNYYKTFRGRVTDAANTGVPFANVTNLGDNNAGTYTDARGFFNLTYPDSVLNVQVRSIGFENANAQLRNNVSNNQVVLKDDRTTLDEVVLSKQNANTVLRKAGDNMKLEEPEPEDGWEKYDTYIVNNLITPKDEQGRQTTNGTVELSFEVDKNGEPTNIKVVKSLCPSCDKEAVRLVKEGPKWKRKAKKGRTTVRIPF